MAGSGKGSGAVVASAVALAFAAAGIGFVVGRGTATPPSAGVADTPQAQPAPVKPGAGPEGPVRRREPKPPEGFEGELHQIRKSFGARDYKAAIEALDGILSDAERPDREWRRAVSMLCDALERSGRLDQRRLELEKQPLGTLLPRELHLLAAMQNLEHKGKRIETLNELLRRNPGDKGVQYMRLHTLIEVGRRPEAAKEVETLRAAGDDQFPRWALSLAKAHRRAGDAKAAGALAEQVEATAWTSDYPAPALSVASKVYALAGDADAALKVLDKWAEVLGQPESREKAGLLKVMRLMEAGEVDRASTMLKELESDLKFDGNRQVAADLRRRIAGGVAPR